MAPRRKFEPTLTRMCQLGGARPGAGTPVRKPIHPDRTDPSGGATKVSGLRNGEVRMSEPDSPYLRVRLSKEAHQRYLESPFAPMPATFPAGWTGLAKPRCMATASQRTRYARLASDRPGARQPEEINAWATNAWNMARSEYDEATETWRFGMLQFGIAGAGRWLSRTLP